MVRRWLTCVILTRLEDYFLLNFDIHSTFIMYFTFSGMIILIKLLINLSNSILQSEINIHCSRKLSYSIPNALSRAFSTTATRDCYMFSTLSFLMATVRNCSQRECQKKVLHWPVIIINFGPLIHTEARVQYRPFKRILTASISFLNETINSDVPFHTRAGFKTIWMESPLRF